MYTRVVHRPKDLRPRHSVLNQWDLLEAIPAWTGGAADATRDQVEMALDRVRLIGHTYSELEIEVELKRGDEAALDAARTRLGNKATRARWASTRSTAPASIGRQRAAIGQPFPL